MGAPRTSQHYGIKGFKGDPQLVHHDAERRQSLGQIFQIRGWIYRLDGAIFQTTEQRLHDRNLQLIRPFSALFELRCVYIETRKRPTCD